MLIDSVPSGVLPGVAERGFSKASPVTQFSEVLEQRLDEQSGVRFSSHAQKRLDERNILLSDRDVMRISKSADDAMARGSKEALLLMDRLALVVGVSNRTVITVMEPHERENTVFTNIDSVVVVARDEPWSR